MKAFILAAGAGTRLGELTKRTPKPLLEYGGRPLLAHTLEWLARFGIREAVINLHHAGWQIPAAFGDGAAFGLQLTYSWEPQLLGTAGGVRKMAGFFPEPFLVVYGDNYYDLSLEPLYKAHYLHGARVEMGTFELPDPRQGSVVQSDWTGKVTGFTEKPGIVVWPSVGFAGLLLLDPRLLEAAVAPGQCADFGQHLFPRWLTEKLPAFYCTELAGTLIDTGTPAGRARVQALFGEGPGTLAPEEELACLAS